MGKLAADVVEQKGKEKTKKKTKNVLPTKLVIRRLPPSFTEEELRQELEPIPEHDFFQFEKADYSFGQGFARAYINLKSYDDILEFRNKFDGYIFFDSRGGEYSAVVEFAASQVIPKTKKRKDLKNGTIYKDPDYLAFMEAFDKEKETLPSAEIYIEEIEEMKNSKKKERIVTPLIEFLKEKREARIAARQATQLQKEKERKERIERERAMRKPPKYHREGSGSDYHSSDREGERNAERDFGGRDYRKGDRDRRGKDSNYGDDNDRIRDNFREKGRWKEKDYDDYDVNEERSSNERDKKSYKESADSKDYRKEKGDRKSPEKTSRESKKYDERKEKKVPIKNKTGGKEYREDKWEAKKSHSDTNYEDDLSKRDDKRYYGKSYREKGDRKFEKEIDFIEEDEYDDKRSWGGKDAEFRDDYDNRRDTKDRRGGVKNDFNDDQADYWADERKREKPRKVGKRQEPREFRRSDRRDERRYGSKYDVRDRNKTSSRENLRADERDGWRKGERELKDGSGSRYKKNTRKDFDSDYRDDVDVEHYRDQEDDFRSNRTQDDYVPEDKKSYKEARKNRKFKIKRQSSRETDENDDEVRRYNDKDKDLSDTDSKKSYGGIEKKDSKTDLARDLSPRSDDTNTDNVSEEDSVKSGRSGKNKDRASPTKAGRKPRPEMQIYRPPSSGNRPPSREGRRDERLSPEHDSDHQLSERRSKEKIKTGRSYYRESREIRDNREGKDNRDRGRYDRYDQDREHRDSYYDDYYDRDYKDDGGDKERSSSRGKFRDSYHERDRSDKRDRDRYEYDDRYDRNSRYSRDNKERDRDHDRDRYKRDWKGR